MEKVVITGGSGFIGQQLAKFLLEKGYDVFIADVVPGNGGKYIYTDITNPLMVYEVIQGAKYVFHLAANAYPERAEQNPMWDLDINVKGTINVINACLKTGARMIFTSTARVYEQPPSNYGISKLTAELYIRHYWKKHGFDGVIVRLNNVFGPTQRQGFVIPDFIAKLKQNPKELQIRGTGFDLREFVYIDDVCEALLILAEKGVAGETYDIDGETPVTIYELALKIGQLMGQEPSIKTEQVLKTWTRPNFENRKASEKLKQLGWIPKITLEEGLKRCIK